MKICIIPPLKHLDLMCSGDYFFCLSHLYIQNKEYRKFFQERQKEGRFIILDNSAAERSLVTESVLLSIVEELRPTEVIAPDVLFNKDQTLKNLSSFIKKMKGYLKHTRIFGCPQGSTKEEWLVCYISMLYNPDVSTIGLSKISVPYCWLGVMDDQQIMEARHTCVDCLMENELLEKDIHFLGMGDPNEFRKYEHPLLRSTDSCYTCLAAINDIDLSKRFKRVRTTNEYFSTSMNDKQLRLARTNISYLRDCSHEKI